MVDSEDKRDFRRMTIDSVISVRATSTDEQFVARATNLSATGLSFYTEKQVTEGDTFEINIEPGNAQISQALHAMVEAVHVEETVPETEYSIGCRILEILPD